MKGKPTYYGLRCSWWGLKNIRIPTSVCRNPWTWLLFLLRSDYLCLAVLASLQHQRNNVLSLFVFLYHFYPNTILFEVLSVFALKIVNFFICRWDGPGLSSTSDVISKSATDVGKLLRKFQWAARRRWWAGRAGQIPAAPGPAWAPTHGDGAWLVARSRSWHVWLQDAGAWHPSCSRALGTAGTSATGRETGAGQTPPDQQGRPRGREPSTERRTARGSVPLPVPGRSASRDDGRPQARARQAEGITWPQQSQGAGWYDKEWKQEAVHVWGLSEEVLHGLVCQGPQTIS